MIVCVFCRRKRKWDQPAESLISALPGVLPSGNVGSLIQGVPVTTPAINNTPFTATTLQKVLTAPSLQQHAVALVQKINQVRLLCTSLLYYFIRNIISVNVLLELQFGAHKFHVFIMLISL